MIKVFKFGGASVRSAEAVKNMALIINRFASENGNKLLVVVSAMGKTTNNLESLYDTFLAKGDYLSILDTIKQYHLEVIKGLFDDPEEAIYSLTDKLFTRLRATLENRNNEIESYDEGYDQIISFGELISTHIIAHYLRKIDTKAVWLDARQYIQTDNTWREGKIDWEWSANIIQNELAALLETNTIITQGFIGGTVDNKTTTLGREGSDFSASVFAHCLNAESLSIWKDVPGVLNADPKLFAETILFKNLSYNQAAEMTYYGATVIHPKTIRPLAVKQIPLFVKSFLEPDAEGTKVWGSTISSESKPAIIIKKNRLLVQVSSKDLSFISEERLSKLLQNLNRLNVKVDMLQNSAISVLLVIDNTPKKEQLTKLLQAEYDIQLTENLKLITVINYTDEAIKQAKNGSAEVLRQQSQTTVQILISE